MKYTADPDALEYQGNLHHGIAKFLRDLADQIAAHGAPIVHELRRTDNPDDAAAYQQWLNPDNLQPLRDEAAKHDSWSAYFLDEAQKLRAAEDALSGNQHHRRGGRNHIQ